ALADKVAGVRADLTAAGGLRVMSEELKSVRPGDRAAYWVRVLDASNHTLAETPGMSAVLPPPVFPASPMTDLEKAVNLRTNGRLFSLVTVGHAVGADRFTIHVA